MTDQKSVCAVCEGRKSRIAERQYMSQSRKSCALFLQPWLQLYNIALTILVFRPSTLTISHTNQKCWRLFEKNAVTPTTVCVSKVQSTLRDCKNGAICTDWSVCTSLWADEMSVIAAWLNIRKIWLCLCVCVCLTSHSPDQSELDYELAKNKLFKVAIDYNS